MLKTEGQKHKQNSLLRSYKNEIKILANSGLALSSFEQPGPESGQTRKFKIDATRQRARAGESTICYRQKQIDVRF